MMKILAQGALLLSLTGCTFLPYIDEQKSKDEVLALFEESTNEHRDVEIPDKGRLRYFIGPASEITADDRASWQRLVDLIERETPLRFVRAKDQESANFVVLLAPPAPGDAYSCSEITTTVSNIKKTPAEPPRLTEVKVEIQRRNTHLLRSCLVRQVMVAIGFQAIDRGDTFSVLNRRSVLAQPTSTDLYLMNLMLKSDLKPHMSRAEREAVLGQQYDLIRLTPTNRKAFAELDAAQRQVLIDALEPKTPQRR